MELLSSFEIHCLHSADICTTYILSYFHKVNQNLKMLVPIQTGIGHFILVAFSGNLRLRWTDELKFVKFCLLIHFMRIQRRGHIKLRFSICAVYIFFMVHKFRLSVTISWKAFWQNCLLKFLWCISVFRVCDWSWSWGL